MSSRREQHHPLITLKRLTKTDRPDGYDGSIELAIEREDGTHIDYEARVSVTDQPWGTEWSADLRFDGPVPDGPMGVPRRLSSRIIYGESQDGVSRLNKLEMIHEAADGHIQTTTQEMVMPVAARRVLDEAEYRARFAAHFTYEQPFDAENFKSLLEDPLACVGVLPVMLLALAGL